MACSECYLGEVDQVFTSTSEFKIKDSKGTIYTFGTGGATLPSVGDEIVLYADGIDCVFWTLESDVSWAQAGGNPGDPPPTSPF